MTDARNARAYSGKLVVIVALAGTILFGIAMGYGTVAFANWLTPILKARAEKAKAAQPTTPPDRRP